MKATNSDVILYTPDLKTRHELPLFISDVHAGFTSPAEDFIEDTIDLMDILVKNPTTTFYGRVVGDCMTGEGIHEGDILVMDKYAKPMDGSLAVCSIDGEFLLRKVQFKEDHALLTAGNPDYPPLIGNADNGFKVWAVVIGTVRTLKHARYPLPGQTAKKEGK